MINCLATVTLSKNINAETGLRGFLLFGLVDHREFSNYPVSTSLE